MSNQTTIKGEFCVRREGQILECLLLLAPAGALRFSCFHDISVSKQSLHDKQNSTINNFTTFDFDILKNFATPAQIFDAFCKLLSFVMLYLGGMQQKIVMSHNAGFRY
jgi:hypothetical protein